MENADRLALAAAGGSKRSFGKLYGIYFRKIYSYIYYRCLSRENAEDITSTVFLKAVENLHTFRPEEGEFPAWLYGIARNSLMDHFRGVKRTVPLENIWDVPDEKDITLDPENRALWEKIKPCFDNLSPQEREIIISRIWDEVPYSTIAKFTGRSEAACRMSYRRAIESLRQAIPLSLFLMILLHKFYKGM
ncbi:MAG: sigma-70 family RNA polymerase sigma factor [Brevinematales bacterium]|jgi:RNA polymerase sigma-70 factor (ECF subfamily)